jgi:hypothetical protein
MAEIHKFQAAPRQTADPGSAERRGQAEAIRQEINKGSRQHANAAKDAAAELWKLFEDRGQDFKRQVCQMVWGAKDPKPTKNLWSLVWDPKKGPPKAKTARKPAALTIYLRLAQAAAKVGGEDEDDVILRVFPNLLNGPEAFAKRDLGPAELLLETFWSEWLAVNERIAADCDLRSAFPVAMELPDTQMGPYKQFRLDHWQVLGGENQDYLGFRGRWPSYQASGASRDFLLGVAPSLFLGECHGPSFRAHVARIDEDGQPGDSIHSLTAWVRIWVRFWWAILPIGAEGLPRGCFVVSLATERSHKLWTVAELDASEREDRNEEEAHSPSAVAPWARYLSASGARNEVVWLDRDMWNKRNEPGLALSWDCRQWSLHVSDVPDGNYRCTAALDSGTREVLTQLFDCAPENLPDTPARILPASARWRNVIFNLPDGALADWVGPDPDVPHNLPPGNEDGDEAWQREEIQYQWRFLRDGAWTYGDFPAFVGHIALQKNRSLRTIGRKFTDSVLLLPEANRPDMSLLKQAEKLRDHASKTMGKITGELQQKMAALGRRTPNGRQTSD